MVQIFLFVDNLINIPGTSISMKTKVSWMSHNLIKEAQLLGLLYLRNLFKDHLWHILGAGEEIYFKLLSLASVENALLGWEEGMDGERWGGCRGTQEDMYPFLFGGWHDSP